MKKLNGNPWCRVFLCLLSVLPLVASAETAPNEIVLTVDAAEAPRRILHVSETIPVTPGPLTLCYAEWIPGEHGPTGPVTDLVSLKIMSAGRLLPWRRDLVDMYAIHVEAPTGTERIDLSFDFLSSPPQAEGFSSGGSATSQLAVINWNQVILYPKDRASDSILVAPNLILPAGWKYGTALELKSQSADVIYFSTVSLTMLVDSPVLSGAHFKRIDISPNSGVPHFIDLAADGEEALAMPLWQIDAYKRLVLEANALFGARHYHQYNFLVTLSSQTANFGLEHHQSSDDRIPERTIIDSSLQRGWASLLPHEFAHSWNGKYRRPVGLAGDSFSKPMTGELLWVYEGFTQYLGQLLTVRSGVSTPEDFRENLALLAARLDNLPGRTWRPLQDVADAAQILYGSRGDWESLRRNVDFYDESYLIWLEAEVMVRSLTQGRKSLTDFCQTFFGGDNSGPILVPYTYDDVVQALNEVVPYDWNSFLSERLESLEARAPLGGIEQSGWRLTYHEAPGSLQEAIENSDHVIDARYSLGIYLKDDGTMQDVIPGSPAALGGLAPGMKLVAINGRKFTKEIFRDALKAGKQSSAALEILASNADYFSTYFVDYHGGERYAYLERDATRPDILGEIIRPIASQ
jgi:predicted metalloprotease with PDZ domain